MRAQPRRGPRLRTTLVIALLAVAVPFAQSHDSRIEAAARVARSVFEPWLGPTAFSPPTVTPSRWLDPPLTMTVESEVAFQAARAYWRNPRPTPLMDGAARYLQSRAVAAMFDLSTGRAGAGVDSIRVFGGSYVRPFADLRFDGPTAGLPRDHAAAIPRAALAFASLERLVGQPRLTGALRSVFEAAPATDDEVLHSLQLALGQEISWLFDTVRDPLRSMNYRVAGVAQESCSPAPCHRVRVDVAHDGDAAFRGVEIRVDFADGQSPSLSWDGSGPSHTAVFEGPSAPVRVRVDPGVVNLLDDNLLDQSKEIGAPTNAPIGKWIARWAVWLQDAMLAYSALV